MITADDVIAAHSEAASFDTAMLAHWANVANTALPDSRLKDTKTAEVVRAAFVMHQMTKGGVDLNAPHVRARVSMPGRRAAYVKAKHPWAGTKHGERVISAVKY